MKKSSRSILTDLLDQALLMNDGAVSADDAQAMNLDNALDLDPSFVTWLWSARVAKFNGVKPAEFLREYVVHKFESYSAGDKGARGDAVEVLVRYYLKHGFVHYNDAIVAPTKRVDVAAKAGAIEIGHNGKTFQHAYVPSTQDKASFTERNYMNGKFEIVIYGAFDKDFTAADLLNEEKFLRIMKVFTDKYEFPRALAGRNGLASGWNVAHERATIQYNAALKIRFKDYCKAHGVLTLGEYISGKERG